MQPPLRFLGTQESDRHCNAPFLAPNLALGPAAVLRDTMAAYCVLRLYFKLIPFEDNCSPIVSKHADTAEACTVDNHGLTAQDTDCALNLVLSVTLLPGQSLYILVILFSKHKCIMHHFSRQDNLFRLSNFLLELSRPRRFLGPVKHHTLLSNRCYCQKNALINCSAYLQVLASNVPKSKSYLK
ncbi:hypothetical protein M378DRAFT_160067 [Amanita muscaria Koide BX008]|uniref:Uncharacterized protein n=1 Tax=Amanita muscaria (strain Koide BX008) TaxID=946122 RepID=A0A0C2SUK7_AMAMK|nr:hypothetical protein M378DRAFT_160067 [Amanita muscaria Koide BX008]